MPGQVDNASIALIHLDASVNLRCFPTQVVQVEHDYRNVCTKEPKVTMH